MKYRCHDFTNAIRFLRTNENFVEGSCFEDENTHFVIKKVKITSNTRGGAHYKRSIWIRQDKLDEWIQRADHLRCATKQNKFGLVYFVHQEGDFDRFKIEYSTNLGQR